MITDVQIQVRVARQAFAGAVFYLLKAFLNVAVFVKSFVRSFVNFIARRVGKPVRIVVRICKTIERLRHPRHSRETVLLDEAGVLRRIVSLAVAQRHQTRFAVQPLTRVTDCVRRRAARAVLQTECVVNYNIVLPPIASDNPRYGQIVFFTLQERYKRL